MTEQVGVIWFECKEGMTNKEVELIVSDFFKTNSPDVKGGKFHNLETIDNGKKLINRFEKALKLEPNLVLKTEKSEIEKDVIDFS